MKYKIYPTLHSEIRKGTVWSFFKINSNLIKIKNVENNKSGNATENAPFGQ